MNRREIKIIKSMILIIIVLIGIIGLNIGCKISYNNIINSYNEEMKNKDIEEVKNEKEPKKRETTQDKINKMKKMIPIYRDDIKDNDGIQKW